MVGGVGRSRDLQTLYNAALGNSLGGVNLIIFQYDRKGGEFLYELTTVKKMLFQLEVQVYD